MAACFNPAGWTISPWRRAITIAGLLLLLALYVLVAYLSPGYDDEFFNIHLVERADSLRALADAVRRFDIHPPGQYVANLILWRLLGDWSLVRAGTAGMAALSIGALWFLIQRPLAGPRAAFAYVAICLNPASLLWASGLRWYAYFLPLLNLAALLLIVNPRAPVRFWPPFFLLATVLFFFGYAALLLVPVAFLVALYQRREQLRDEVFIMVLSGGLALLLCAPQLFVFLTQQLPRGGGQVASWGGATAGLAVYLLSGQGALPVALFGIVLILFNALLLGHALLDRRLPAAAPVTSLFVFGTLALYAARLTGKYRNLVPLASLHGVFQVALFQRVTRRLLVVILFSLLVIGNLGGVANVVRHQDTVKGSWNTPYAEVLAAIRAFAAQQSCATLHVTTHDPVFTYYLRKEGYAVSFMADTEQNPGRAGCRVALLTARGSLRPALMQRYRDGVAGLPGACGVTQFGRDRFAAFKRLLDPDLPDYYVGVAYFCRPPPA